MNVLATQETNSANNPHKPINNRTTTGSPETIIIPASNCAIVTRNTVIAGKILFNSHNAQNPLNDPAQVNQIPYSTSPINAPHTNGRRNNVIIITHNYALITLFLFFVACFFLHPR